MEIVAKVEGTEHFHALSRFGDRRQDRPQSQNFSKTLGSNCIQEGQPNVQRARAPLPILFARSIAPKQPSTRLLSAVEHANEGLLNTS